MLEKLFEELRPEDKPQRMCSIFVTKLVEDAAVFMQAELARLGVADIPTYHIYRVTAETVFETPMVLIRRAETLMEAGQDASEVVHEYWSPTRSWQWLEGLTLTCEVLEQVASPGFIEEGGSRVRYDQDSRLAQDIFPTAP